MSVPVKVARRRWIVLMLVRIGGIAGALLGLVLAARAEETLSKVIGVALVIAALVVIAVLPASLAHRWRSPDA